jgi:primosomal replication protein N
MSGSTLIATSLTLTVSSRTVEGRVTRVGGGRLTLRMRSGSTVIVDFPAGVTASDGSHRLNSSSVRVGAYLRVMGYVERSQALRAVTAQVLHLTVDFSGAIIASGRSVVVETSRGERYQLHFSSSSEISTGNEAITLKQTDIPVGARVHVYGTTQSDGSLAVSRIEVHLKASTVRGTVSAIAGSVLSVQTPAGTIKARSCPHTVYLQGSHALTLADIVVGDDVTVYGYADGPGLVLVRKLLVHRRLVGLTGSVASLTADGFTLTAADGAHRVIVTAATLVTGGSASDLQVGVQVHATGYLRGDGAVLATRLKLNAKRSA